MKRKLSTAVPLATATSGKRNKKSVAVGVTEGASTEISSTGCWLLKSEPDEFSIENLSAKKEELWTGIRNHQAKNYMKAMKLGDTCFFYHSSCKVCVCLPAVRLFICSLLLVHLVWCDVVLGMLVLACCFLATVRLSDLHLSFFFPCLLSCCVDSIRALLACAPSSKR